MCIVKYIKTFKTDKTSKISYIIKLNKTKQQIKLSLKS